MKYLSILPFFTLSKAQETTEQTEIPEPMMGRNLAMTRDMLTAVFENDNRFITEGKLTPNKISKSLIKDYGCFCYAGGSKIVGSKFNYHGPGLDKVDNLCRELFFKQKCFAIDTENGVYETSVVPEDRNCQADNKFRWFIDDNNQLQCGDKIDSSYYARRPCKMNNCELEKDFVLKVAELYLSGNYDQNKEWKFMSDEEYKNSCQANAIMAHITSGNNNNNNNKNSDGANSPWLNANGAVEWSEKSQFNILKNQLFNFFEEPVVELNCCGNGAQRKTYNTMMKECCDDGSVKFIDSCA